MCDAANEDFSERGRCLTIPARKHAGAMDKLQVDVRVCPQREEVIVIVAWARGRDRNLGRLRPPRSDQLARPTQRLDRFMQSGGSADRPQGRAEARRSLDDHAAAIEPVRHMPGTGDPANLHILGELQQERAPARRHIGETTHLDGPEDLPCLLEALSCALDDRSRWQHAFRQFFEYGCMQRADRVNSGLTRTGFEIDTSPPDLMQGGRAGADHARQPLDRIKLAEIGDRQNLLERLAQRVLIDRSCESAGQPCRYALECRHQHAKLAPLRQLHSQSPACELPVRDDRGSHSSHPPQHFSNATLTERNVRRCQQRHTRSNQHAASISAWGLAG